MGCVEGMKKMVKIAGGIFAVNVGVSWIASELVPRFTLNNGYMGMSLPVAVMAFGVMAYLFLFQKKVVGKFAQGLLVGSFCANLFERVVFGNVLDWIPCGIGYCNTADLGLLAGLIMVLWRTRKNAE